MYSGRTHLRAQYAFNCRAPSGAICVLPDGSSSEKLVNLEALRRYACQNARSWYRYINGPRGRGAENGSIYLVTGCEKTESWGMAAYLDVIKPDEFRMSFGETGLSYDWIETGQGQAKSGYATLEPVDGALGVPRNQCMFIHGFKIALGQGVWGKLFNTAEISSIEDGPREIRNPAGSFVPFRNQSSWFSPSRAFSTWGRTVSNSQAAEDLTVVSTQSDPDEFLNRAVSISVFPDLQRVSLSLIFFCLIKTNKQPDSHPSTVLNEYLLYKVSYAPKHIPELTFYLQVPDAEVVIVHNSDWLAMLQDVRGSGIHMYMCLTYLRTRANFLQRRSY